MAKIMLDKMRTAERLRMHATMLFSWVFNKPE
ncbi:hypothetical protein AO9_02090 [Chlamydia psittaci Mat116]|nr:hypothetical protein AO9_02090 [Chlamydia psittaci Mat116]